MYVSFDELSEDTRIWIYLANKSIDQKEQENLSDRLKSFLEHWNAHGKPLKCSFKIAHSHFIIIAVDESYNDASGCSIDESVHFLQNIEMEYNLDLFDKKHVPFLFEKNIRLIQLNEIKNEVERGVLDSETLTFNPIMLQKKDLLSNWIQPAGSSWLRRYMQ